MNVNIWGLVFSVGLIILMPRAYPQEIILSKPVISIDLKDKPRLQRGAKIYMNYCSGCHSLKYLRFDQMALDLGLTAFDGQLDTELLTNNLIFTHSTPHDPVQVALPPEDAQQWFGIVPPDLSLSARVRGSLWLYQYLHSFYEDHSRPFGANNLLIPGVAMPNILGPLIGKTILGQNTDLLLIEKGTLTQAQFDTMVLDLVTFLVYVGEPTQLIRYQLGIFIILFLMSLFLITYWLKAIYWKRLKNN
jgi:ubiquinol-cytochrome c reductase cytochrome c1 subunit